MISRWRVTSFPNGPPYDHDARTRRQPAFRRHFSALSTALRLFCFLEPYLPFYHGAHLGSRRGKNELCGSARAFPGTNQVATRSHFRGRSPPALSGTFLGWARYGPAAVVACTSSPAGFTLTPRDADGVCTTSAKNETPEAGSGAPARGRKPCKLLKARPGGLRGRRRPRACPTILCHHQIGRASCRERV